LNTKHPNLDSTIALKESLETKYGVSVVIMDCLNMEVDDVETIFEELLFEFPVKEITINLPRRIEGLPNNHWIRSNIMDELKPAIKDLHKLNQVSECLKPMKDLETVENVLIEEINLGEGIIHTKIDMEEELFFNILNEITGYKITGDHQILGLMNKLAQVKKEYDKIEKALVEAKEIGYGLVSPTLEE